MALINNGEILGKPNKDLILETSGHLYIKVRDKLYEIDYGKLNDIDSLIGKAVEQATDSTSEDSSDSNNQQQEQINLDDYITSEDLRRKLKNYVTTRSWEDVTKTQKALENALLNGYTQTISPITVSTMQISVGSEQLQFEWVKSFTDMSVAESPLKLNDDGFVEFTPGYIKHYTLDGPSSVTPDNQSRSGNDYWRWQILNEDCEEESMILTLNNDEAYYCYLVVPYKSVLGIQESNPEKQGTGLNGANISLEYDTESGKYYSGEPTVFYAEKESPDDTKNGPGLYAKTGTGYFYYTQNAVEYNEGDEWYYMLYAIVTNGSSCPSISTMNGFTEITPGQVRAYLFASPDGTSFLDLQNDKLKLGERLMYGDGNLLLDGVMVQRDGTGEQPITIFRGEWSSVNTYTQNDIVTYTVDGNVVSYICKSKVTSDVTPDQDTEHWGVYATGTKGDPGEAGKSGAISRFRKWNETDRYYDGKTVSLETEDVDKEVYYLDYVSYADASSSSWTYWKCIGFDETTQNINIKPGSDAKIWVQISSFETLSTGTMLIGTNQGWYIDGGVIKHSSGNLELRGDGTIIAGDVTISDKGEPELGDGGFYVTKNGTIGANSGIIGKWKIDSNGIAYADSTAGDKSTNFANVYPNSFWIKFDAPLTWDEVETETKTTKNEFKINSNNAEITEVPSGEIRRILYGAYLSSVYTKTLPNSYANVLNYEMPACNGLYLNTEAYTSNYNFALNCGNGTIAGFKPAPYYITGSNQMIHTDEAENNDILLNEYSYYWVNNTSDMSLKLPSNPKHGQYIKLIHMNKNKTLTIWPNDNQTIYSVKDEKTIEYVNTSSRISLEFQYLDYLYIPNGSGEVVKTSIKQWFLYKYALSDT